MGTVPFLYMMYSRSLSALAFAIDKKIISQNQA